MIYQAQQDGNLKDLLKQAKNGGSQVYKIAEAHQMDEIFQKSKNPVKSHAPIHNSYSSLTDMCIPPANPSPVTSAPPTTQIKLQNSFSPLCVEDFPPLHSAPNSSLMTPPSQRSSEQAPQPRRQSSRPEGPRSPPKPTLQPPMHNLSDPDIIIFSNSMCAQIRPCNFYRGKTTNVIARSGVNILDVQNLIADFQDNITTVKCVILQAWTNRTAN